MKANCCNCDREIPLARIRLLLADMVPLDHLDCEKCEKQEMRERCSDGLGSGPDEN